MSDARKGKTNILVKQIEMLVKWNESHMDSDPEKVQKNVTLIIELSKTINDKEFCS